MVKFCVWSLTTIIRTKGLNLKSSLQCQKSVFHLNRLNGNASIACSLFYCSFNKLYRFEVSYIKFFLSDFNLNTFIKEISSSLDYLLLELLQETKRILFKMFQNCFVFKVFLSVFVKWLLKNITMTKLRYCFVVKDKCQIETNGL